MNENRPNEELERHEDQPTVNKIERQKIEEPVSVKKISREEADMQCKSSLKDNQDKYKGNEHYEIRNCRQISEKSSKYDNGMFTMVEVEGQAKGNFLIDSGSALTLLSSTLFEKLDKHHLPAVQQNLIPLLAVDGQEVRQYGTCVMNISIGKSHYQHATRICDLPVDGILGQDFLIKHVSQINLKESKLYLESEVISCRVGEQDCQVQELEKGEELKGSKFDREISKTESIPVQCTTSVHNQNEVQIQTPREEKGRSKNSTPSSDAKVGSSPTGNMTEKSENRTAGVPEDDSELSYEPTNSNQFRQQAEKKSTQLRIIPERRQDTTLKHQRISAARRRGAVRRPGVEKRTERIKQKMSDYSVAVTEEVIQHCKQSETCKVRKCMKRTIANAKQRTDHFTRRHSLQTTQADAEWIFSPVRRVRGRGKPRTRWKRPNLMAMKTDDLTLSEMPRKQ